MFCISTFKTSRDLNRFLYYHDVHLEELEEAQGHPYLGRFAKVLVQQVLLNNDFKNGTNKSVDGYISWAEEYLEKNPDPNTYHNLALAYYYIGENVMMKKTVNKGLYFFPQHPLIMSVYKKRDLLDPLVPAH